MSQLHVVFGSGPIGLATAGELVARNLPVRVVNRSGRADVPAGVEVVAADARPTPMLRPRRRPGRRSSTSA